jgi:hypothetical protein
MKLNKTTIVLLLALILIVLGSLKFMLAIVFAWFSVVFSLLGYSLAIIAILALIVWANTGKRRKGL